MRKIFLLTLAVFMSWNVYSFGPRRPNPRPEPPTEPNPRPPNEFDAKVHSFALIDEETGLAVSGYEDLKNGAVLDFSELGANRYNIRVYTEPHTVGSVSSRFSFNSIRYDNQEPYLVFENSEDMAKSISNGNHILLTQVFEGRQGQGARGQSLWLRMEIKNHNISPDPDPDPDPEPEPSPPEPPSNGELPPEPKYNGTKTVTQTIVIDKPGVYDFKKVLHVWKGKSWNCNGEKENGPQILRIEASDVTVKNFYFVGDGRTKGSNGLGDPVHVASCGRGQGNGCPANKAPKNVTIDGLFGHACEDLLTIGTPNTKNITVKNSYLKPTPNKNNWDKTIQINFGAQINFYNNVFAGGTRCIRYKPNTNGEVIGNKFYGCRQAVLGSSNDADISPMKNGPVTIRYVDNQCFNCRGEMGKKGSQVRYITN